jgi:hypothetical protein
MAADVGKTARERIELWRLARMWYVREVEHADSMRRRMILLPADAKMADERRGNPARCDVAIAELTATAAPSEQPTTTSSGVR